MRTLFRSQRPLRLQRKLVPGSTSILSTGALLQAHLLLRGRCRPTVTFQAFMLGCGTEKMLLSRGNNGYPVAAINSSQVSNGILRAQGVSEKLLFSDWPSIQGTLRLLSRQIFGAPIAPDTGPSGTAAAEDRRRTKSLRSAQRSVFG